MLWRFWDSLHNVVMEFSPLMSKKSGKLSTTKDAIQEVMT